MGALYLYIYTFSCEKFLCTSTHRLQPTLPEIVMEVENHLFVEENGHARGHNVPSLIQGVYLCVAAQDQHQ